jgi:hypothetical protein
MAAWLVTEDPQQLVRVDSITTVAAVPVNDRGDPAWHEVHPAKRFSRSNHAKIMVGTSGGDRMCALTCPSHAAAEILAELMAVLGELASTGRPGFVHGPRGGSWPWRPTQVWQVASEIPEPDVSPR